MLKSGKLREFLTLPPPYLAKTMHCALRQSRILCRPPIFEFSACLAHKCSCGIYKIIKFLIIYFTLRRAPKPTSELLGLSKTHKKWEIMFGTSPIKFRHEFDKKSFSYTYFHVWNFVKLKTNFEAFFDNIFEIIYRNIKPILQRFLSHSAHKLQNYRFGNRPIGKTLLIA
uniref:Uncharacterized protein n=1 Tax=Romanomermis culicivorax TaxID=13658 RepID=A0A915KB84_ROMCU